LAGKQNVIYTSPSQAKEALELLSAIETRQKIPDTRTMIHIESHDKILSEAVEEYSLETCKEIHNHPIEKRSI
jgi:hypothetical protein